VCVWYALLCPVLHPVWVCCLGAVGHGRSGRERRGVVWPCGHALTLLRVVLAVGLCRGFFCPDWEQVCFTTVSCCKSQLQLTTCGAAFLCLLLLAMCFCVWARLAPPVCCCCVSVQRLQSGRSSGRRVALVRLVFFLCAPSAVVTAGQARGHTACLIVCMGGVVHVVDSDSPAALVP
jgi:hypothetical protein